MNFFHEIPEVISRNIIMFSYIISFFSLIPQIILNQKVKSGKGISDFMLLGGANGHCARLYYHFFAQLPLIYRLVGPLSSIAFFTLIIQRFYYDKSPEGRRLLGFFCCNILFFILILPMGYSYANQTGAFFGWMTMPIWFVYQLPQLYKIQKTKSVDGFSKVTVILSILAGVLELIAAFVLGLSMITIINNLRSIFFSLLFFVQFKMYGVKKSI